MAKGYGKGDLVRFRTDVDEVRRVPLPDGEVGCWGMVTERAGDFHAVLVAGAGKPFGHRPDAKRFLASEDLAPFSRMPEDEPSVEAAVRDVLVRLSWTLPEDVSRDGDVIVAVRDGRRDEATFRMNPVVAREVAPYLGADSRPNEAGHALLDRMGVGESLPMSVKGEAYEASRERRGAVTVRDAETGTQVRVEGDAALRLVALERKLPRFADDGKLTEALRECLPYPRTLRLDTYYSKVRVAVVDVDGDAVTVRRDDEVLTFVGAEAKKVRRAAAKVFDIARWTKEKLPALAPAEGPGTPSP